MTKKIQKTIAVGITVVMLLGILPLTAQAAVIMSGPCGDSVNYTLTDDGVLTLSGKGRAWGDMNVSMRTGGRVPWADKYVRVLKMEEGVTGISDPFSFDGAFDPPKDLEAVYFPTTLTGVTGFYGAKKLKEVYVPEGAIAIGAAAFQNSGLTRVYVPSTTIAIDPWSFKDCDDLKDIYFGGTKEQWEKLTAGFMWFDDTETWEVHDAPVIVPSGVVVHYNAKDNHPLKHLMPNSDSLPSEWARETVKELQKSEIFPSQILPPETPEGWRDPMNRLTAVISITSVLWATAGYIDVDRKSERFSDMDYGDIPFETHTLSYASRLGIAKGKGNGKFDPNGTLTRAELAAMINRAAKAAGVDISGYAHSFNDVKGHWSDKELGFVYNTGIMAGTGGGRFEPNKTLTREECFITSYRFYKWLAEKIGKKW